MLSNNFYLFSFIALICVLYGMYGIITKRLYITRRRVFFRKLELLRGKQAVAAGIIIILFTALVFIVFLTSWMNQ